MRFQFHIEDMEFLFITHFVPSFVLPLLQGLFFVLAFWLIPGIPSLVNYIVSVGGSAAVLYLLGAGYL